MADHPDMEDATAPAIEVTTPNATETFEMKDFIAPIFRLGDEIQSCQIESRRRFSFTTDAVDIGRPITASASAPGITELEERRVIKLRKSYDRLVRITKTPSMYSVIKCGGQCSQPGWTPINDNQVMDTKMISYYIHRKRRDQVRNFDGDHDGNIDFQEFILTMRQIEREQGKQTAGKWRKEFYRLARGEMYSCYPPAFFLILISAIQIFIRISWQGMQPTCSILTLNRERRWKEPWRFVTYMLEHTDWRHCGINVVNQLFIGIPLEMVHSSWRVAVVYIVGVAVAGLGWSVLDSGPALQGASGGLYALYLAHGASIALNFRSDSIVFLQRLWGKRPPIIFKNKMVRSAKLVTLIATVSMSFYVAFTDQHSTTSHLAHFLGGLTGFFTGLVVLKARRRSTLKTVAKCVVLFIILAFTGWLVYLTIIENMNDTQNFSACAWNEYSGLCQDLCYNGRVPKAQNCTLRNKMARTAKMVILFSTIPMSFNVAFTDHHSTTSNLAHFLGGSIGFFTGQAALKARRRSTLNTTGKFEMLFIIVAFTGWLVYLTIVENRNDT